MKAETPVLRLRNFEAYEADDVNWVCKWFVRHYFGVLPEKISLEFSDEETEDSVAIVLSRELEIWQEDFIRWKPCSKTIRSRWYEEGDTFLCLERWIKKNLPIEMGESKTFYVSVWIYE